MSAGVFPSKLQSNARRRAAQDAIEEIMSEVDMIMQSFHTNLKKLFPKLVQMKVIAYFC